MKTKGKNKSSVISKVPWSKVNWDDQDVAIARRYGCSRERVRQKRKQLGVGKSPKWHSRQGCAKERILALEDTSGMTLKEISDAVSCSKSYVLQCLKATGGTYKASTNRGGSIYNWAEADWSKGYREIAKDLGIDNPNVVSQYRHRHRIKSAKTSAADIIVTLLKKRGKELTVDEAVAVAGCSKRYAESILKREQVML